MQLSLVQMPFQHETPDGRPEIVRLDDLVDKVVEYDPDGDVTLLHRAYVFSAKAHKGQMRISGEPYLTHPLQVAGILTQLRLDVPSVASGLLHDTLEDTVAEPKELKEMFGGEVLELVEGVTKIGKMKFISNQAAQSENIRKMILAMSQDIRVVLIKLADRLHNMQTLGALKPEKRRRIATETLDIYAPLANRLGISWIKNMMEDLSLRAIHPEIYDDIDQKMRDREALDAEHIESFRSELEGLLGENEIKGTVYGRAKHYYSIYKKMEAQRIVFDQINDIIAFRIIAEDVETCYRIFGLIHAKWTPVPGRVKDFIAVPKANHYQSLHTTVIGPHGERAEIQIRTRQMHRVAEEGIAAHWKYKEGRFVTDPDQDNIQWLLQLVQLGEDAQDAAEFVETVKTGLYEDEVFVFTPRGEIKRLPQGATALDFAYSIHSEVGNHAGGALIDKKMVPLRTKLKNGNTVEIMTGANHHPSRDWIKFVKTSKARQHARNYLRRVERSEGVEIGKELLEKAMKNAHLKMDAERKAGRMEAALEALGHKTLDDLWLDIGYGKKSASEVVARLKPEEKKGPGAIEKLFVRPFRKKPDTGVLVGGQRDIMIHFAQCCNPINGEEISGFVTQGKGVTVHRKDCARTEDLDPERMIQVSWDKKTEFRSLAKLRVVSANKPGLLAKLSNIFARRGVNIQKVAANPTFDGKTITYLEFDIAGIEELDGLTRELKRIGGVVNVERI